MRFKQQRTGLIEQANAINKIDVEWKLTRSGGVKKIDSYKLKQFCDCDVLINQRHTRLKTFEAISQIL